MANVEMLRPYVEQKVAELLGVEKVNVDETGNIPIRSGSAVCFARLLEGPTGPMFRVFSPMLKGVKATPALLERLNTMNADVPYVRFFHVEDVVYCSIDVVAENMQREEIEHALSAITFNADQIDDLLKNEFGGERMIEDEPEAKADDGSGYL